ncbi:MAG: rod shape-determining protein RodA [Alphaproteobacteria bacterium]|nr:rod shape-determining protein RodA [Alphaproteobacteria bacterium]
MSTYELYVVDQTKYSFADKVRAFPYGILLLLAAVACVGIAMLYAAAGGNWDPWASRQATRFGIGVGVMICVALIDIKLWLKYAYVAYGISIAMLVAVELFGTVGKGAQRWLDLGLMQFQPSELVKLMVVLVLARVFHSGSTEDVGKVSFLLWPMALIALPAALILRQPDLGTTILMLMVAASVLFLGGVRLWKFILAGVSAIAAVPVAWHFLRDYQKNRVYTFLDPESDPLGAGYHIIQSKIALGSGGLFGKGFMNGSQSHLQFLPEKQTDFIFTMLAEEWGLVGAVGLIALYVILIGYGFYVALASRSHFGRLLALGCTVNFFLYVFVNIAMVIGLIPVKGAPLPLVSWGGSAQLTVLIGYGLIFCVSIHREVKISRNMMGMEA